MFLVGHVIGVFQHLSVKNRLIDGKISKWNMLYKFIFDLIQ